MTTSSQEYGKLIDQLRKDRLMSRQELVDGIMSQRSYQRFASGQSQVSNTKLNMLIDRLGLEPMNVKQYFAKHQESALFRFVEAHKEVMKLNYNEAKVKLATIDKDSLKTKISLQEYEYLTVAIERGLKNISQEETIELYKEIVNYPEILNYKVINIVEFNVLQLLNTLLTLKQDYSITEFFKKFLDSGNSSLISLEEDKSLVIYAVLAQGYYNLKDYESVIDICNKGILYSKTTFGKFGIVNLFAYKAASLLKMLLHEEANQAMIKTYMLLLIEDNSKKTQVYIDFFKKEFNIDISKLITINK